MAEQLSPERRAQINAHLAKARTLIGALNTPTSPIPADVQDDLARLALPLTCGLADMVTEADQLGAALNDALARPWAVRAEGMFNALVEIIRQKATPDAAATAVLSFLVLEGVQFTQLKADLSKAEARTNAAVWAALKAAPKLAIVTHNDQDQEFTVELWDDGELRMTAPIDVEALRHFLVELRQDHWDVRFAWEIDGAPTPAGFPAEQEVAAHG